MAKNVVTRKQTQWGKLREIHGYKNCEIAETLGHDQALVSGWFTGRLMPNDENIKELCELFGEDFERGKQMFLDDYQPSGKRKTIEPKQAYYIPNIPEEPLQKVVEEHAPPKQFNDCIKLASFLHGKIDIDIVLLLTKEMDLAMTKFNKDPITALQWSLEDLLAKFNAQNITSRCKPRDILHLFDIFASAGYKFYQEDEDDER